MIMDSESRTKTCAAIGVSALVIGSIAAQSLGQIPQDFKPAVRSSLAGLAQALAKEDIAFFERNSTNDFIFVDHKGKAMGKKEALKSIEVSFDMYASANVRHTIHSTGYANGMGSAKVTQVFFGAMPPNSKGKRSNMKVQTVTMIFWKKVNGKWLFHKVKELRPAEYWLDGKRFNPFAPQA